MITKLHLLKEVTRHAPLKKEILRHSNNNTFMTGEAQKTIMLRQKLKNILKKNRTLFNWLKYKHLQSFCLHFFEDFVLFIKYSLLCNYEDDNNLFVIGKNKEDITSLLLSNFRTGNN